MIQPTVTAFGSCRVHTPCSLLQARKIVALNQKNIFGFVHYTSEVLQQFDLIAGAKTARSRLRPYMNIPVGWADPSPLTTDGAEAFHRLFSDTDIFVVEVSSVRKLRFKTAYLQINRVRELLVSNDRLLREWWNPLIRTGENRAAELRLKWPSPVQEEVASTIWSGEQSLSELIGDLRSIKAFLKKPVLFVSHFNADYNRASIVQRKLVIEAMDVVARDEGCFFFDPTPEVLGAGLQTTIQDLGHYKPAFEPFIARRIGERLQAIANLLTEPKGSSRAVPVIEATNEGLGTAELKGRDLTSSLV